MAIMASRKQRITPIATSLLSEEWDGLTAVVERDESLPLFLILNILILSINITNNKHSAYVPFSPTSGTSKCYTVSLWSMSVSCYTAVLSVFLSTDVGHAESPASSCGDSWGSSRWIEAFVCWSETCHTLEPAVCVDRWVSITAAGQSHGKLVLKLPWRSDGDSCVSRII